MSNLFKRANVALVPSCVLFKRVDWSEVETTWIFNLTLPLPNRRLWCFCWNPKPRINVLVWLVGWSIFWWVGNNQLLPSNLLVGNNLVRFPGWSGSRNLTRNNQPVGRATFKIQCLGLTGWLVGQSASWASYSPPIRLSPINPFCFHLLILMEADGNENGFYMI